MSLTAFLDIEEEEQAADVAYVKSDGKFLLFTISEKAIRLLKRVPFVFNSNNQAYQAEVKLLPKHPEVNLYEHKVKAPSDFQMKRLADKYSRYLKMLSVLEKMEREIEQLEDGMIDILQKHGLKLKPGSPQDSQLLVKNKNTRLHFQRKLSKIFDQAAIEELAEDYEELQDCIKIREVVYLDKAELAEVLPTLPSEVTQQILTIDENYCFVETHLKSPDCNYCGRKVARSGHCTGCGVKQ